MLQRVVHLLGLAALTGCAPLVEADPPPICATVVPSGWEPQPPLPAPRESTATLAHDGALHVLGGWSGAAATDTVFRLDDDGWTTADPLPAPREHHVGASWDGALYIAGGDDGAAGFATAWWNDGSGWEETLPLPEDRVFAASASADGHLYVIGGLRGFTTPQRTVYRAELGDGVVSWTEERALPEAVYAAGAAILGNRLVVGGGALSQTAATDAIFSAEIADDGSLGPWEDDGRLDGELLAFGLTAVDDRALLTGGLDSWDDTLDAVGALDGEEGAPLDQPRFAHGQAIIDGTLFAVGGWSPGWTTVLDDVVSANVIACE